MKVAFGRDDSSGHSTDRCFVTGQASPGGLAPPGGLVRSTARLPFYFGWHRCGQEASEALPTRLWFLLIGPPLPESLETFPEKSLTTEWHTSIWTVFLPRHTAF